MIYIKNESKTSDTSDTSDNRRGYSRAQEKGEHIREDLFSVADLFFICRKCRKCRNVIYYQMFS